MTDQTDLLRFSAHTSTGLQVAAWGPFHSAVADAVLPPTVDIAMRVGHASVSITLSADELAELRDTLTLALESVTGAA